MICYEEPEQDYTSQQIKCSEECVVKHRDTERLEKHKGYFYYMQCVSEKQRTEKINFSYIINEIEGERHQKNWLQHTRVYPKVSGLAVWSENRKCYSSLPLGAVASLFCEFCRRDPLCCFSTSVCCCCLFLYRLSPETFGYTFVYRMKTK
jgi:hypothetical protein